MIQLIVFDIDGVITDGSIIVDALGTEQKRINLKDVDAIYELHKRGFKIAAITGEDTAIVDYFEKRFPWNYFIRGSKLKGEALNEIVEYLQVKMESVCYVGDGKYDIIPLTVSGLGICPSNAIDKAKQAADIILQNGGGEGCIWELVSILEQYNCQDSSYNYFCHRLDEHTEIFKKLASDQKLVEQIMEIGELLISIFNNEGGLYLCGNGGSASDAQHIATEFVSRFYRERPGLNAEALSVNTSTITAIGNDYSFERIFVRQLEAKARRGDMVIGISTSGTSRNVLEALSYARKNGLISVLLTGGADKTDMVEDVDYIIKVPSLITPRIQEAHIFIGHVLAEYVEHKMFGCGH